MIDDAQNRDRAAPAQRAPKLYRTKIAFGPYPKDHVFSPPTGGYREMLIARGVIEPVEESPPQAGPGLFAAPRRKQTRGG